MARRFSRLGNMVHSKKHIVQQSVATVALGARTQITIANAVVSPTAATEVAVGSKVNAVFVEMWVTSDDATQGSTVVSVEKLVGGGSGQAYADTIAMDAYDNKNNVFHITQGLTPPNVQSGIPFFRGWIKVPAGKQRMALNDYLILNISGITNGAVYCGFFTYKEYS